MVAAWPCDAHDEDAVSAHAYATPQRSWFELALDHAASGVALALVRRASFDPSQRLADGRTLLERALVPPCDEGLLTAMTEEGRYAPLQCLSDGRTVYERLLVAQPAVALSLVARGLLVGTERLGDGTTAIERAVESSGASGKAVAAEMAKRGGVDPHATCSTGVSYFERMLCTGELDIAARLAQHPAFDALERTVDGRTLFELALDRGASKVVLASLASGKLPARALLSDGRTPLERALRLGSKELVFGAFAGQGLKPTTPMPPDDKTVFELALEAGAAEFALVLARFGGLDGLFVLGDGRTCFERAIAAGKQELAVAMAEAGSVTPTSRLPNGSTCLEFAASNGARLVCEALAKRV
jgi:hypothetical protein